MRRAVLLAGLLLGCMGDLSSPGFDGMGQCPPATSSLQVSPELVTRNEPVSIDVLWSVYGTPGDPVIATLQIDDIQVDLGLTRAGEELPDVPGEWHGSLLNPFGEGAPSGYVSVLVQAQPGSDCGVGASAAASFELQ
jgi:hypothetical protein